MSPEDLHSRSVWVVAKGYAPDEGGMQTYAQGVAEAYARSGALVTVFTQTSAGPRTERHGRIFLVDVGAGKGARAALRLLSAMRGRKREAPPFLVHGTTWRTAMLPMILRLPYYVTFHGREFMYASGAVLFAMRKVARTALLRVAVSRYSAAKLATRLHAGDGAVVVAWNGAQAPIAPPTRKENGPRPLILSLCRLETRKNIMACARACAILAERGVPFRYVIAGRGPERQKIAHFIETMELGDRVELTGYVSDETLAELYRDAEIFLHPQIEIDQGRDFEGFGIVIADAMRAGAAVIVGRDGGAIELVEDGVSGLIVDGRDEDALVAALTKLLENDSRRREIGAAAAARARTSFTWDRHVETILDAIEGKELLTRRRAIDGSKGPAGRLAR